MTEEGLIFASDAGLGEGQAASLLDATKVASKPR